MPARSIRRPKQIAHRIFRHVAEAEAKVHGTTIEKVHFHEVGAIDSIADIVGSAVAMHASGIDSIIASPVPTGTRIDHDRSWSSRCAGAGDRRIAVWNSDRGIGCRSGTDHADRCCHLEGVRPQFRPASVDDYRSASATVRATRIWMARPTCCVCCWASWSMTMSLWAATSSPIVSSCWRSNVDDSTPEQLADCADRLLTAGALDVFQTACTMKKGRAGVLLTVVATVVKDRHVGKNHLRALDVDRCSPAHGRPSQAESTQHGRRNEVRSGSRQSGHPAKWTVSLYDRGRRRTSTGQRRIRRPLPKFANTPRRRGNKANESSRDLSLSGDRMSLLAIVTCCAVPTRKIGIVGAGPMRTDRHPPLIRRFIGERTKTSNGKSKYLAKEARLRSFGRTTSSC